MQSLSRLKIHLLFFLALQFLLIPKARADYRVGVSVGYGGSGLSKTVTTTNQVLSISRSDGPLVTGLTYERLFSDTSSYALDYTQGITFSPFSAGVGFAGVTWRWYFWGEIPSLKLLSEDKNFVMFSKKVYFAGFTTGLASGSISREGEEVSKIKASGLYIGFRGGYDNQVSPGRVERVEFFTAQSMPSSGKVDSQLGAFALTYSWIFLY